MNFQLQHSKLNKSIISPIGLGTWPLGGLFKIGNSSVGRFIESKSVKTIIFNALDVGINFFDTAGIYGNGLAEKRLGSFLPKNRDGIIISTKFGNLITGDKIIQDFSNKNLIYSLEKSLRNLKTDSIDILLLHSPPENFDWGSYDQYPFQKLVSEGKIRRFGVSCTSIYSATKVMEAKFGNVLEIVYNVFDKRAQDIFYNEMVKEYNIIFRMPLAYGLASANFNRVFHSGDHRTDFKMDLIQWMMQEREKYSFLDSRPGGLAVSALRFSMSNPINGIVIVGVSNPNQLEDIQLALRLGVLPANDLVKINQIKPAPNPYWGIK